MIQRRAWLFLVGGGLLAACAGPEGGAPPDDEDSVDPADLKDVSLTVTAAPGLLILTGEGRKIGRTYTRETPSEAKAASLLAELPRGVEALSVRIASDYAGDDVVVLRGWILARTEARLLALGALQGGPISLR